MVVPEHALVGIKEIAEYLCLSPSTIAGNYIPRLKEAGIIFYRRQGKIPHRQHVIYTFPSLIQKWLINTQKALPSKSKTLKRQQLSKDKRP